jgi:hypothetical protein
MKTHCCGISYTALHRLLNHKRASLSLLLAVQGALCAVPRAHAEERLVPSQYPTIQAAVNAANDSDQVILADGIYTGPGNIGLSYQNFNRPSRALTLRSASGDPTRCIVDAQGNARAIQYSEGPLRVFGLTFRNGYRLQEPDPLPPNDSGGAIDSDTDLTISNCVFDNNAADYLGGAVAVGSNANISRCLFTRNTVGFQVVGHGGAIGIKSGGQAQITNCIFLTNGRDAFFRSRAYFGGAIFGDVSGSFQVANCVFRDNFADNSGGAISSMGFGGTVVNCTFVENYASADGNVISCVFNLGAYISVHNSVLWNQNAAFVSPFYATQASTFPSHILVSHSDVSGPPPASIGVQDLGGNFSADPLFRDAINNDFHPLPTSPLLNAGSNALLPADGTDLNANGNTNERLPLDADGSPRARFARADIGAYEFQGPLAPVAGLAGGTVYFDGSGNHAVVPGFGQVAPTEEVTIEFWQKVDGLRQQSTIECNTNTSTNRLTIHAPWSNGVVYFDFGDINYGHARLQYTPPVSIVGTWQHFACVARRGHYMRIYRNGVLEAEHSQARFFVPGDFDLRLGNGDFAGELDEVRIWNRARSESEILADMNAQLTGHEPGLLVYYRMDEAGGNVLTDHTPNHRHATLQTAPGRLPSGASINILNVIHEVPHAFTLGGFDYDGLPLQFTPVTLPDEGTLGGNLPNAVYTSSFNFDGHDLFTYKVSNGAMESNTAQVDFRMRYQPRLLSGTITLEDCQNMAQPIRFYFLPLDGSPLFTRTTTLSANGDFDLLGLPDKDYKVWIKGAKWLATNRSVNLTNGDVSNLNATLLAGDANDDDSVDVLDLDVLIQAFDADPTASHWNENADLNCDGSVDVLDLDILIRNFDRNGGS